MMTTLLSKIICQVSRLISANNLRKKMTNKFEIAKEVILRRLDKAGTYRPIDEDVARRIVCSVLDAKKHALRYYFQSIIKDAGSAAVVAAAPCCLLKVSRSSNRSCGSDFRSWLEQYVHNFHFYPPTKLSV